MNVWTRAAMLLVCGLASAAPAFGQREWSVDVSLYRATVGYARQVAPRTLAGVEVGIGISETSHTFTPAHDQPGFPDYAEFLHVGAFARSRFGPRFDVDSGLRVSVADLWICPASDCWPELFAGVWVQPMVGWKRVKFGGHLIAGWISESRESSAGSTFLIAINPLIARITF